MAIILPAVILPPNVILLLPVMVFPDIVILPNVAPSAKLLTPNPPVYRAPLIKTLLPLRSIGVLLEYVGKFAPAKFSTPD